MSFGLDASTTIARVSKCNATSAPRTRNTTRGSAHRQDRRARHPSTASTRTQPRSRAHLERGRKVDVAFGKPDKRVAAGLRRAQLVPREQLPKLRCLHLLGRGVKHLGRRPVVRAVGSFRGAEVDAVVEVAEPEGVVEGRQHALRRGAGPQLLADRLHGRGGGVTRGSVSEVRTTQGSDQKHATLGARTRNSRSLGKARHGRRYTGGG